MNKALPIKTNETTIIAHVSPRFMEPFPVRNMRE